MLKSHEAKTTISIGKLPKIMIDAKALQKMSLYVDLSTDEIGWLGIAKKSGDYIVIEDVYLLEQQVHSATCEITPDGLANLSMEILREDPEHGLDKMQSLRFWGHSHVNMEVTPSGQDDAQMNTFRDSGHEWFIRGIANKKGKMKFDYFDYATGAIVYDVPWELCVDDISEMKTAIQAEINEKVSRITPTYYNNYAGGSLYFLGGSKEEDDKKKQETEGQIQGETETLTSSTTNQNGNTTGGVIDEKVDSYFVDITCLKDFYNFFYDEDMYALGEADNVEQFKGYLLQVLSENLKTPASEIRVSGQSIKFIMEMVIDHYETYFTDTPSFYDDYVDTYGRIAY